MARRLGTTQSAIARLESQKTSPRFETVVAAVRACDLELHLSLTEPDYDHRRLIDDALSLTPGQRLDDLVDRLGTEELLHRARKS
jgi:transcriptional regulator with XRE-family HTH domain